MLSAQPHSQPVHAVKSAAGRTLLFSLRYLVVIQALRYEPGTHIVKSGALATSSGALMVYTLVNSSTG